MFTLRQFYARRFLRIFPLYYFAVAVLWLMNDPGAHRSFGWLITYTTDIEHVVLGYRHDWPRWTVAHFWSLAVEEQFYLVWPCVVLLLSRRRLIWFVCGVICCGPAFRLIASWLGARLFVRSPLPFYWVDALGLGALLAVASDPFFGLKKFISPARIVALVAGVLLSSSAGTSMAFTRKSVSRKPATILDMRWSAYGLFLALPMDFPGLPAE